MNWENYGSDREETAQLAPSTENEIVTELQTVASKRRRERLALGITVLLSAAVVSGVVLHSSRRTAVTETTLAQTGAQVSAFRSEVTNFGIEEGKTIKCGEDDDALYRMSNNERHYYPSTEIAAAWDSDWQNPVVADCTDIPQGADMSYPSDTMDKSAADAAWSPATPSDPPVSGPYDILDENEAEGSELEPSGQSESQPEEMQPEESEPEAIVPEESEPGAIAPDASEPGYTAPDASEPDTTGPEYSTTDTTGPEYSTTDTTGPEYSTTDTSGPEYSKAEYTNGTEPEGSAPDMTSPDTTTPQEFEPTKDSLWQPHEPTKATQWELEEPTESTEWEPKDPSQSPLWEPKEPAEPWETKEPVEPLQYEPTKPVEPLQYEPTKPVEPKTWDSVSNTFEPAQYEPKTWGSNAPVAASHWEPAPDQKPVEPVPFFNPVPAPKPANYAPQPSWPAVPAFPANGNNYQTGSTPRYPPSNNYQNGNAPQYPPSNTYQNGNAPQYTNAPPVVGKELTPAEMKKALEDQVKNLRAQAPGGKTPLFDNFLRVEVAFFAHFPVGRTMNEHDDGVKYAQINGVLRFALATFSMKRSACEFSDASTQPEPNYDPEPPFTPTKAAPQIQPEAVESDDDSGYADMDALLDALQTCLECMQETRVAASQYDGEVPVSEHDDVLRMLSGYLLHSDARDVILRALMGELVRCDETDDEDYALLASISKLLVYLCFETVMTSEGWDRELLPSSACEQVIALWIRSHIHDSLLVALTEMQEQEVLPESAATRWVLQTIEEIQSLLNMLRANDHNDTSDSSAFVGV